MSGADLPAQGAAGAGKPKRDWYAIGWTKGVHMARERIRQAEDVEDALNRIDELLQDGGTR